MNKKTLLIVGGIVVGLFLLSGKSDPEEKPVSLPTPTVAVEREMDASEKEFYQTYMETCVEGEATFEYCDCAYNYLVDKYGFARIVKISLSLTGYEEVSELPDEFMEAALACL